MVVLEIIQEVNDVAGIVSSNIDSPTITQRKIETTVAVHSGETLVLGGHRVHWAPAIASDRVQPGDDQHGVAMAMTNSTTLGSSATTSR